MIGSAADNVDRWFASNTLIMMGFALFLVATLGVMHMLRERGAAFGHIGGAVALLGILAAVAGSAVTLVIWQMPGGDRTEMVALLDRVFNTTGSAVPILFLSLGVTIGYLVLMWGLASERLAPLWMTGAIACQPCSTQSAARCSARSCTSPRRPCWPSAWARWATWWSRRPSRTGSTPPSSTGFAPPGRTSERGSARPRRGGRRSP